MDNPRCRALPGTPNHTAGTLGYLHTGDLRAVQELLGHADPRMTARYTHVLNMATRNPALFVPVKAGEGGACRSAGSGGKLEVTEMPRAVTETFKAPSADDPVLAEVVRHLVDVYRPLRIYLFGSAARGDAGPDSDYDFMVVVPDEAPVELQHCDPA